MEKTDDLDELDWQVMRALAADGRIPNTKLARMFGTNEGTIRRRVQRLISEGTMRVRAVLNPTRIGYPLTAYVGLEVKIGKTKDVCTRLAQKSRVQFVGTVTGRYDVLMWVRVRSPEDLAAFLGEELSQIDGIVRSEAMVVLDATKVYFPHD